MARAERSQAVASPLELSARPALRLFFPSSEARIELNQVWATPFTAEVGDVVKLAITGNLKEEFGGTPIRGQDCVVVRK